MSIDREKYRVFRPVDDASTEELYDFAEGIGITLPESGLLRAGIANASELGKRRGLTAAALSDLPDFVAELSLKPTRLLIHPDLSVVLELGGQDSSIFQRESLDIKRALFGARHRKSRAATKPAVYMGRTTEAAVAKMNRNRPSLQRQRVSLGAIGLNQPVHTLPIEQRLSA